jgi:hypothetical protein
MSASSASNNRSTIKNYYKNNPWKGRFILTSFILLLILILARAVLPHTIIYSATSWLKQQNIDSSIESININLLSGTVSLNNAQGSKNGEPLFNIGRIDIHWHWTPLKDRTVTVTKVALDQFSINIEQYSDEMIIGGVTFPLTQAAKVKNETAKNTPATEQSEPWAASLGEVVFTNLDICYLQHFSANTNADATTIFVDYCIKLEEMTWTGNINYATDKKLLASTALPVSTTGDFTLNGLSITDNKLNKKLLVSKTNTLSDVTISGLENIHIKQLNMEGLWAMQRDDKQHKDAIRFDQLTLNDIKLNNLNTLFIKDIKMNKPGLYLVKYNQADWEYQQWIPANNNADSKIDSKLDNKTDTKTNNKQDLNSSPFKVALNNITINNADLCYLDNASTVYYCYTSDHFSWQGDLSYSNSLKLTGKLSLSNLNIRNHSIDRNLLELNSVALNQLDIKDLNTISIGEFNLKNLHALQRGEDQNDSTLAFNNLAISSIQYSSDNINIDTIELDGLANHFSKNDNGEWEHSKWLTQNKDTSVDNADKNTGNNKDKTTTDQPFIISLNSLTISTDNNMLFTDNSTEPAMKTGLQKLDLDISKLDSTKPDSDSPFKLFAQTTRHGTINIEGTAKPFAEKVSFDAKGKLKGFDLRAASPASKKAIGHIIKSGQLDADLTLLAKEGVLDSNLALSLYHFNIKPMSKKDAEALDEKFGMPLNQTLILLRDKDDSIHLDIPVTGDINNPDFNPMDAIIKATSKAATVTLITFYTPYGLVYAGGNILFDLATAMNFDPVEFKPGTADIKNENKEQLNNLAKLMSEKPQIRLTLCGLTNIADLHALYPALKAKKKENKGDKNAVKITNEQSVALTKLAQQRQINIKNYLIKESAITHDRLILCAPEHQADEDSIAGVEINI